MEPMERKSNPHQDRHSGTTNGVGLPRDLIIDILSRLPAKFICQFRCVSKPWLSILSPPDSLLQNLHRNRSNSTPLLMFSENSYPHICLSSFDTQGQLRNQFTKHISSPVLKWRFCQGLMCFICEDHVYVCNPSTQVFLQVPYSIKLRVLYNFALGYLPSTNEYKIVHWFVETDSNGVYQIVCQIFTLKEGGSNAQGSWRVIGNSPHFIIDSRFPICLNGSIYWFGDEHRNSGDPMNIYAFDLATEEYETVLCPRAYSGPFDTCVRLLSIKGTLCLVDFKQCRSHVDIWMMKDQSNQIWVKEYSFDMFTKYRSIRNIHYIPSGDGRDEEILIGQRKEGLLLYNIKTRSIRKMGKFSNENTGIEIDMGRYLWPHLYFDSLDSLVAR
ncbi:unnamed protein product [Ilex paraguariensis]|uniref:F-box domain-containing protein n=1 Tax=Ilex paraguariensis TaxID=185542 RepID=A0ABC8SST8_9AQUA